MSTLQLTIKKRWFDMIATGVKREEYRKPSKWILSRLEGKSYDLISFRNGYKSNSPTIICRFLGWTYGYGRKDWGGGSEPGKPLVVIKIGEVLFRA